MYTSLVAPLVRRVYKHLDRADVDPAVAVYLTPVGATEAPASEPNRSHGQG